MEVPIKDVEEDSLEVIVHKKDDDSDASAKKCEFNGCIRTLAVTDLTLNYDRVQLRTCKIQTCSSPMEFGTASFHGNQIALK